MKAYVNRKIEKSATYKRHSGCFVRAFRSLLKIIDLTALLCYNYQ